ncbi:phosphate acyltransferase PlsX [Vreelandella neptunia]|uniref:Phosphate acyltransferase n=1 Tax=Vreelandella neptunia TaxID=115551 RepID=A0ABS9S2F5_9GAMM|nr:phosphate acyltransferase PlsX [Halomonas neptunia]MCH4810265.1 phosphate acyltransferase PlsX [Halomonas neptunia]
MRLAIDVMGGDQGPHAIIAGSAKAAVEHPGLQLTLFGPRQRIIAEISRLPQPLAAAASRLVPCDAPDSITPSTSAAWALRNGHSTSMVHMLRSVAQGEAAAGVSAGNTAALVALARRELGMIEGISRPAISTAIPARQGRRCYLLDLGANVDSPAHRLVDFALMGAAMAQCIDGTVMPRVALLNVGAEATKGSASVREADRLLREYASTSHGAFDYQGYAEGGDLFKGQFDVVVCDGFVGNAVLKASEGLTSMLVERVQMAFESRLSGRLASLLAKPVLKRLKKELDPVRYNGASLLGLRGIVVKSHGSTHADGFYYAIQRALQEVEHNLPARIAGRWQASGSDLNGAS